MGSVLFDLTGKRAVVTGAAQGLGRGMALGLADAGAAVALVDRQPCDETAALVRAAGGRAECVVADLAGLDDTRAAQVLHEAAAAIGGMDILVNNAGIIRRSPTLTLAQDDWSAVLDIDLTAPLLLSQAAARRWVADRRRGKIVLVASMLSFVGGRNAAAYAAAKSGVAGLTRSLAVEWAPLGIGVNAVAPGWFATELTGPLRADPARSASLLSRIPAGRWGEPDDLRGAAVFLASDASDYVHGAVIPVDGGYLVG